MRVISCFLHSGSIGVVHVHAKSGCLLLARQHYATNTQAGGASNNTCPTNPATRRQNVAEGDGALGTDWSNKE